MYKLLIACRAGVGSSLMLKIKTQQVIKENNFPIEVEHGSLDSLNRFNGDAVETLIDVAEELKAKTDNIYLQQAIDMLNGSISAAVVAANQTYVDELKKEDAFTPEAQKEAFEKVYQTAINSLTEETKNYLNTHIGDLESYIKNRIEQEVVINKE